ncbi:DUF3786 domain-containing protein [Desulfobacca acetoxidans]|nr:hypothetical protein [Desulfobacterales bacterium]
MYPDIFERHYIDYCDQIAKIDWTSRGDRLGIRHYDDQMVVPFFNRDYTVSGKGIFDSSGNRPEYMVCVIIAKYILLCPDQSYYDMEWVSFKDFKRTSHFTNVNYFASDTEQAIEKTFRNRLDDLFRVSEEFGGIHLEMRTSYDFSMQFKALPRISLLLLFNDGDEEFPAYCTVLFQKQAEYYLDPESLAMTSAFLAKSLKELILKHSNLSETNSA